MILLKVVNYVSNFFFAFFFFVRLLDRSFRKITAKPRLYVESYRSFQFLIWRLFIKVFSILLHVIQHQVAENIYKFAVLWASSTKTWAESVVSTASLCVWITWGFPMSNFSIYCGVQSMSCTVFLHVSSRAEKHLLKWDSIRAPLALQHRLLYSGPSRFWMVTTLLSAGWNFFLRFPELSELSITTIFLWSLDLALFPNTTSRWSNLLYLYSNSYKQVFNLPLSVYLIYSNLTVCFKTLLLIFGNNILHVIDFILEKQPLFVRGLNLNCIFICFRHV